MVIRVRGDLKMGSLNKAVAWKDGVIFGTAAEYIEREASRRNYQWIGPHPGHWSRLWKDHIRHPRSFLFLVSQVFEPGYEVTGDVPKPDPVPEGFVVH